MSPARRLPALRPDKNACESPHLVIVGAGGSRAACPSGDAQGQRLPLMADLVAIVGLDSLLDEAGVHPDSNFELAYQRLAGDPKHQTAVRRIEAKIQSYFEALALPHHATLYDRLLLSLRGKDFVATFNWDPLLAQAYLRNRSLRELPRLLFLHGNVAIGVCVDHDRTGFLSDGCDVCSKPLTPTALLYPIGEKNYDRDRFIRSEWVELRAAMRMTYILTIVGYAAPESDVEARAIMLEAWEANQSKDLAQIDIVDIKSRAALEATWAPFFVRDHYGVSTTPTWLFRHARRTCDHFAMATLQNAPCQDTPLPETESLAELHGWAAPLIQEEIELRERGKPLRC